MDDVVDNVTNDVVDNVTNDVVDCVYCMILTGILHSWVSISTVHSDPTRTFVHVTVFPTTIIPHITTVCGSIDSIGAIFNYLVQCNY